MDDELKQHYERVTVEIMRERGQSDMADLFMNNRPEYGRRKDAGRTYFYAADYDVWKTRKLEGVTVNGEELKMILEHRTENAK